MFFVGHISLAFLIVYFISKKFPYATKRISIPLIMLLSIKWFKHRKKNCLFLVTMVLYIAFSLLLVLAVSISVIYILNKFRVDLAHALILIMLHSTAIATVILLWVESKGTERQQHLVSNP